MLSYFFISSPLMRRTNLEWFSWRKLTSSKFLNFGWNSWRITKWCIHIHSLRLSPDWCEEDTPPSNCFTKRTLEVQMESSLPGAQPICPNFLLPNNFQEILSFWSMQNSMRILWFSMNRSCSDLLPNSSWLSVDKHLPPHGAGDTFVLCSV